MVFNLDVLYRMGVSERVDLGLRVAAVGGQVDAKLALFRGADPRHGLDLSVAPGVGVGFDSPWGREGELPLTGSATLPLLLALNLGDWQLALTPQVVYTRVPVLPAGLLTVGGTVAFGPIEGRGMQIYPAVAVWRWVDPRDLGAIFHGLVVVQPALVVRWGR
jgi:hypothetical protein